MKVIEDSADRLVLEDRPVFFATLMGGMIVFSIALMMIAWRDDNMLLLVAMLFTFACAIAGFRLTNRRLWLTLDRAADRATLKIRNRKGFEERHYPLGSVRASVQAHRRDNITTNRPVLLVDSTSPPEWRQTKRTVVMVRPT